MCATGGREGPVKAGNQTGYSDLSSILLFVRPFIRLSVTFNILKMLVCPYIYMCHVKAIYSYSKFKIELNYNQNEPAKKKSYLN